MKRAACVFCIGLTLHSNVLAHSISAAFIWGPIFATVACLLALIGHLITWKRSSKIYVVFLFISLTLSVLSLTWSPLVIITLISVPLALISVIASAIFFDPIT
jgi:hypothetical protein